MAELVRSADLLTLDAKIQAINQFLQGGTPYNAVLDAQKDFGCLGNGIADDRVAAQAALDAAGVAAAAGAGKVAVFFAPGTYLLSRAGGNAWALNVPSGVEIFGVRGSSWLKFPVGMPAAAVAILRMDNKDRITVHHIGLDGNWGNAVGLVDADTGINHADQTGNPQHFGMQIRGSTNISISDVDIKQVYGDGIEIISSTTGAVCDNVNIQRITVDMCGRHALTFSNGAIRVSCRDFSFTNIYAGVVDTEPVGTFKSARDVVIERGLIGRWWSDAVVRFPLSIVGSDTAVSEPSAAKGFRVRDVTVLGPVLISSTVDVALQNVRVLCDYATNSYAPVTVDHNAEGVLLDNVYVYDRAGTAGDTHLGGICVRHYGTTIRPGRVTLRDCHVDARNGRAGIAVDGPGGVRAAAGTATGTTATSLTDSGAAWDTNGFAGCLVRIGKVVAPISANTATALTLHAWYDSPFGASDAAAATPAPGAYVIMGRRGEVIIENCSVDCTDDGWGAGGVGLYLDPGDIQVHPSQATYKVRGLTVRNATADAVQVQSRNASNPIRHLELVDVHAIDDQPTPTCTVGVRFAGTANVTKAIMRGLTVDGVASAFAGVGASAPNLIKWLVNDGERQDWEGFGAPAFTAAKGSTYLRKDGGASTTLYVNETGNSTWRAV